MAELKDSGNRQEFSTGAVRDIQEGKGRCDLLPLDVIGEYYIYIGLPISGKILKKLDEYQLTHESSCVFDAIRAFEAWGWENDNLETMILDISKHFEDGAKKYGENNWRKGIPCKRYLDSAIRHFLKYVRGDCDEPHDRAVVWNLLCCEWTNQHYGWDGIHEPVDESIVNRVTELHKEVSTLLNNGGIMRGIK